MRTDEMNGKTFLYPVDASDVSEEMLELAEQVYDGWFSDDERIDWEEFIDRLCKLSIHDEPSWELDEYDNGAVRKIQKHIREYRKGE